jgi:hypothetical protein
LLPDSWCWALCPFSSSIISLTDYTRAFMTGLPELWPNPSKLMSSSWAVFWGKLWSLLSIFLHIFVALLSHAFYC